MLQVMAQNIPPKSLPPENTKNLSPSTAVCVLHFRNEQNFKYTQRWAGYSSQKQRGQPAIMQHRLRKTRENFNFHKTSCKSVCRQPGSLHTSHEFPTCCCRLFWHGKDPLFETAFHLPWLRVFPGLQPMHAPPPLSEHTAAVLEGFSIYLTERWQKRDP